MKGPTRVGARCRIGPTAFIGLDPQFRGFQDGQTWLIVGDDNVIREGVSLHRSTKPGDGGPDCPATRVGSRCFFMANAHVGHDVIVGDDVTMANATLLGGHVTVGARVFMGGASVAHQFCRVGRLAIVGGGEIVTKDVPPFAAMRWRALKGYNAVGCRRSGMSPETIHAIRSAFHTILAQRSFAAGVAAIDPAYAQVPEVRELIEFAATSKRGVFPSVRSLFTRGAPDIDDSDGD
jgi:UDP-N-acetylglucosamine acyltransferase